MSKKPLAAQSLYFILLTVLIDSIGFGLIIPVMPELLGDLLHEPGGGPVNLESREVAESPATGSGQVTASSAAKWGGYLAFCYAAMHFLFGPLIGNLSDRWGRRPVLLVSLGALAVDYLILAYATTLWVLFLGRILTGICGATFSTANAYIADVSDEKNRGKAFGLVGAAFGIGFILGPAIGGFLGGLNVHAPFYAAAGMAFLNMLYGYFVLPESLKEENRRPFSWARANPLGAFRQFSHFGEIRWLLLVSCMLFFSHVVYPSTWNYHGADRYGWGSREIGLSLMAFGICSAIVQGGLIGRILKKLGERNTAFLGISCNIIAMAGFAFSSTGWMLYCWIPLSALGAVATPAIKSIMSSRVSPQSQGELQGTLSSLQGISNMVGPIVLTQVYDRFAKGLAGFPFYGSAFLLAGLLLCGAMVPLFWGTSSLRDLDEP